MSTSVSSSILYRVERRDVEKTIWHEEFATRDKDLAISFVRYRATPHEEWRIKENNAVILVKGRYEVLKVHTVI